jgi:DNA-binding NarL/FixJ family response regulator
MKRGMEKLEILPTPQAKPRRPAETLTSREKSLIPLVCQGLTNREIAVDLGIAERTVKNELRVVYLKRGTSDRNELTAWFAPHTRPPADHD